MAGSWQLTFDCADPSRMTAFWAAALGYDVEPPPHGFADWISYWRHLGVPDEELTGDGAGSLVDPAGVGPRIWFQVVPEGKSVKNRLHLDSVKNRLHLDLEAGGGRLVPLPERRARVDARMAELVVLGASLLRVLSQDGLDHYAVVLADPEGNELCIH